MALIAKKAVVQPPFACKFTRWVVTILLFIVAVIALVGVYQTHVLVGDDMTRIQFGSTGGSLAILAFVVSLMAWVKSVHGCGCQSGK